MSRTKIIIIAGPTASGKTACAVELAERLDGEIVSADSMQLYKYMDIGSAKPTEEEQARARHWLVDEIDPRQPFSAAKYREMAGFCIDRIAGGGKLPIVCGGTGLYVNTIVSDMDFSQSPPDMERRKELRAVAAEQGNDALHAMLERLDPDAAGRIHPNNVKRTIRAIEAAESGHRVRSFDNAAAGSGEYECLMFGLNMERQLLYDRINRRVDMMMEAGLVDEVRGLMDRGLTADDISMKGIGYKEIIGFLNGEYDIDHAVDLVKKNTRHLAKRQLTWFRRYDGMIWYDLSDEEKRIRALDDMEKRSREFLQKQD